MSERIREAGGAFGAAIAEEIAGLRTTVDETNRKVDETNRKADEANHKADEANRKLDETNRKVDETNDLLRSFLDVFHTMEKHNWQAAEQRYVRQPDASGKPPFRIVPDAAALAAARQKRDA